MKTPTRAELEKMSYAELEELAAELADEDEEIKTIRHYFIDEFEAYARESNCTGRPEGR